MTDFNFKGFLTSGAFLQTGPDLFKLLMGPFTRLDFSEVANFKHSLLFYKPDFWDFLEVREGLRQDSVYAVLSSLDVTREEFLRLLGEEPSRKATPVWENPNEGGFRAQFEWSQAAFKNSELTKTVPVIRQSGHGVFGPVEVAWSLRHLLENKNFGWSYGFFDEGAGLLGHTPEILAQWSEVDRRLHTVALAGTYPKGPDSFEQIQDDPKIQNEHGIVIEDIRIKLEALSSKGKITQGPTDVLELRHLLHLMTEFEIDTESRERALEIIKALHPTSAMGLFPDRLDKLREFSRFGLQQDRGAFASPFAIIEKGAVNCVVAIRNLFYKNGQLQIYSGCGVTSNSDYGTELAELETKRGSVKKMLGLE